MIEYADELSLDRYLAGRKKRCSRQRKWPNGLVNFGPCDCCGASPTFTYVCVPCCSVPMPQQLTITVSGMTGSCACWNGTYTVSYSGVSGGIYQWLGSSATTCSGTSVHPSLIAFSCITGFGAPFFDVDLTDGVTGFQVNFTVTGTCSPLSLSASSPGSSQCPDGSTPSVGSCIVTSPAPASSDVCLTCCPNVLLPGTLQAVITDSGFCPCLDGTYELTWNPTWNGGGTTFTGAWLSAIITLPAPCGWTMMWALQCNTNNGQFQFLIMVKDSNGDPFTDPNDAVEAAASYAADATSCDPFEWQATNWAMFAQLPNPLQAHCVGFIDATITGM